MRFLERFFLLTFFLLIAMWVREGDGGWLLLASCPGALFILSTDWRSRP